MAILDTLIAELLKDGVGKATGGKGIAKKLEEVITKESGKSSSPGGKETTKAEQKQAAAIRNAFTLGAPSDDRQAKARAMAAQAIFNDLERSKASPEELAAAKREADSWANWAAMPKATRENILSRGRRQAELGNAESKMSDVMRERQTPGATELLRREAVANAGGPRITGETITDGRVTNRQVTGRYGSGSAVDTGTRGAGDPRLRAQTEQLLLDQGARAGQPPSYAQQILADYQTRITPQQPASQVAQVPVAVAPQPLVAAPVSTRPMGGAPLSAERIMGGGGSPAFSQLQAPPIESFTPPAPVPVAPSDIALAAQEAEAQRKATGTNLSILSFQDQWQKNNLSNNKDMDAPGVAADVARFNRRWRSPEGTAEDLLFANTWQPKSTSLLTPLQEWRNGILARRLEASKKKQEESQGFSFPPL